MFYPNQIFERKAVDQCNFVRDHLRGLFIENNTDCVIGAHLFSCYKQCGFKGNGVQCTQDVSSSSQFGRFPAGRCYILSEPRDSLTSDNHLHILVFAPPTTTEYKPVVSEGTRNAQMCMRRTAVGRNNGLERHSVDLKEPVDCKHLPEQQRLK